MFQKKERNGEKEGKIKDRKQTKNKERKKERNKDLYVHDKKIKIIEA